jgi:hypothetical protein
MITLTKMIAMLCGGERNGKHFERDVPLPGFAYFA